MSSTHGDPREVGRVVLLEVKTRMVRSLALTTDGWGTADDVAAAKAVPVPTVGVPMATGAPPYGGGPVR